MQWAEHPTAITVARRYRHAAGHLAAMAEARHNYLAADHLAVYYWNAEAGRYQTAQAVAGSATHFRAV